jgi:S-DNA-T family DNA segregation ATPase FtsK/SpoIIIE
MAKRKKRRESSKKFPYKNELYGIGLILLSVLGIGMNKPLGLVGKLSRAFSVFLVGSWDLVFLVACFLVGGYLLIKRSVPKFFNSRLIGIYILFIGILVFSHLSYVNLNDGNSIIIFKETLNNLMSNFDFIMNGVSFTPSGGGLLGCTLAVLFNKLFDYSGTKIVAIILMITGGCLFTGVSIIDIIKNSLKKGKEMLPRRKSRDDSDDDESKEPAVIINDNTSNKMVVSSIEELTNGASLKQEEKLESNEDVSSVVQNSNYKLPSLSILNPPKKNKNSNNQASIENNIVILERVLKDFGIIGKVVEVNSGPSVTQYEMEIQSGTKLSRILSINREISLALAKKDVRIQAPIPGKSTIGIEIANDTTAPVSLREILETVPGNKVNSKLLVALGKNIMGSSIYCEVDKTPHLLVAGATGSGKSVCINCIIASILMRTKPDEVKLMMVDPKKVELSMYNGIPHLMMPVVTDPKKASVALQKVVSEMESRYDLFSEKNVKNIATYNEWVDKQNAKLSEDAKIKKMPYIVVIVDELADLMLVASKEVEDSIMRITQMARAAGIHLIIATQRPSTDVITGVVKANIPSRISFAVSSSIDSRTILDMMGAEKLLGKGDMLFLPMGENAPQRVQGAYVSDEELQRLVDYTVSQQKAQYDERFMNLSPAKDQGNAGGEVKTVEEEYDDPLYNDIVEFVVTSGKASASLLQRRFKLGYNRAARIVDLLEERGIIGPPNGSKPREVLVKLDDDINEE